MKGTNVHQSSYDSEFRKPYNENASGLLCAIFRSHMQNKKLKENAIHAYASQYAIMVVFALSAASSICVWHNIFLEA